MKKYFTPEQITTWFLRLIGFIAFYFLGKGNYPIGLAFAFLYIFCSTQEILFHCKVDCKWNEITLRRALRMNSKLSQTYLESIINIEERNKEFVNDLVKYGYDPHKPKWIIKSPKGTEK